MKRKKRPLSKWARIMLNRSRALFDWKLKCGHQAAWYLFATIFLYFNKTNNSSSHFYRNLKQKHLLQNINSKNNHCYLNDLQQIKWITTWTPLWHSPTSGYNSWGQSWPESLSITPSALLWGWRTCLSPLISYEVPQCRQLLGTLPSTGIRGSVRLRLICLWN